MPSEMPTLRFEKKNPAWGSFFTEKDTNSMHKNSLQSIFTKKLTDGRTDARPDICFFHPLLDLGQTLRFTRGFAARSAPLRLWLHTTPNAHDDEASSRVFRLFIIGRSRSKYVQQHNATALL